MSTFARLFLSASLALAHGAGLVLAPLPGLAEGLDAPATTVVEGQTSIVLPDTSGMSAVQREILALERQRSRAIAAHDTRWLAGLYADDFQGVVANGQRVDQSALLGVFARDNPQARFRIDELAIRVLAPVAATVTGRLQTLNSAGTVVAESRYLHVYVRRGKRWQIVAAEGTAVAQPQR